MYKDLKEQRAVKKPHVKKDDIVVVLSGDDKGKKGRVIQVVPDKGQVYVEGVNLIKKHLRPSKKHGKGGIVQKEGPIFLSKVALFCTSCNKITRAKVIEQNNELARVCKLCNEPIGRK